MSKFRFTKFFSFFPFFFYYICSMESVLGPYAAIVQPQIRKSWDSMENANKKRK